jgi:hypothetical protein
MIWPMVMMMVVIGDNLFSFSFSGFEFREWEKLRENKDFFLNNYMQL